MQDTQFRYSLRLAGKSQRRIVFILCIVGVVVLAAGIGAPASAGSLPQYVTQWGSSPEGSFGGGNGSFHSPQGVAVNASGYVYVTDVGNYRVQVFTASGTYVEQWGSYGTTGNSTFNDISGIAVNVSGYVYVADANNNRIQVFTSSGTYVRQWGSAGSGNGSFSGPQGVAVNASGYVYVADTSNNRIQVFTPSGTCVGQWGSDGTGNGQFEYPWGIAVNASGYVYVNDQHNFRIQVFTPSGTYVGQWGSDGTGNGQFDLACGIAVDPSGYVYVADTSNNRIQVFTPSGTYVGQWGSDGTGNGQFNAPFDVKVNATGSVYVSDDENERIEMFSPLGITFPAITSISPTVGTVSGDTNVTITGSGFTGVSEVTFGSTASTTFTVNNDTSINAISPVKAAGPVHTTVTNPEGTSTTSSADQFTYGVVPVASFNGTPTYGTAPLSVQFTDTSTGSPTSWNWSFGDGNFSTLQNPDYTYKYTGTFTVSLNATGTFGSNTSVRTNYIIVTGPTPIVDFNGTPTKGFAPLNVQFTDLSSDNPSGRAWFFGDENYTESWTQQTGSASWSARDFLSSVAMPDGNIVLMGGDNGVSSYDDVWRSKDDGATWTRQTAAPGWQARTDFGAVAMPDGSIVIMGGNCNVPVNDVWMSTDEGSTWTEVNANAAWPARFGLRSVVMPDGSIVIMGGQSSTSNFFNDVWRSTDEGYTWNEVNASAGWPARAGFNIVVMPDNSIVLMGGDQTGYSGEPLNDVWRSTDEGYTWNEVNASAGWSARYGQRSAVMPDGSIILMGGKDTGGNPLNDVWRSTDEGYTWNEVNANPGWSGRFGISSVTMPDSSIVLMGGRNNNNPFNDVWRLMPAGSSAQNPSHTYTAPGTYQVALQAFNAVGYGSTRKAGYITVSAPPVASFSANVTSGAPSLTVQFHDTSTGSPMPTSWNWSFGDGNFSTAQNPVYTYASTGSFTVTLTATNTAGTNTTVKTSYINVYLVPVASFTATPTSGAVPLTVQFSDTSTGSPAGWAWFFGDENYSEPWAQKNGSAGWTARMYQSSVVMPDGNIVLMGGYNGEPTNDVWRSKDEGATWTVVNASAAWSERFGQSSVVMPDGNIVLMGGYGSSYNEMNDVWRSTDEGATWTVVNTSAGWAPSYVFNCEVMPDGSIVVIPSGTNSVWRSKDEGATWTEVNTNAGWSIRWAPSCVVMPDGSIVLMGGQDSNGIEDDVWRSTDEGATWTEVNTSAGWPARDDFSSVAMPDGSIVLMGGWTSFGQTNNVWRSTDDGATWTEVNTNPGWSARYGMSVVVMPDGSIVLMGGSANNDVWQLKPVGSASQNPSHTYSVPGIYPVALQAYNDGGYNSTLKAGYITISAPPVAGFSANVTSGFPSLTVQFHDTSTGVPTRWNWSFGDGIFSTLQNPIHTYTHSGDFTVSLTAANALGTNTQVSASYVDVYPPPVADFTSDVTSGTAPLTVQFTDLSSGSPTGWAWFFGDETYNEGWNQVSTNTPIWTPRYNQSSVVMPDGNIVLMGGYDGSPEDDVWLSPDDGATWMEMNTSAGWSARYGQSSVVMPDGSIILMAGFDGTNYYNDVWQSTDEGATWNEVNNAAPWSGRYGQSCVVMPDGSIVLMGGQDSNGLDGDVWQSWDDGTTWTEVYTSSSAPMWTPRYGQSSVVMPDGSIVLIGGFSSYYGFENDVWQSWDDGATWNEVNAGAYWTGRMGQSGRTDQSCVAMPDGSIVLMGGYDGSPEDDVWQSPPGSDGAYWNYANFDPISSGRYGQSSVAMPDGSIVLMGGYDWNGNLDNDVWQLWPAGSYYTPIPSHTYNSPGSYSVALEVSNSAGYNSTLIPGDITVTEPPAAPFASFTSDVTTGAPGLTVQFYDTSTGVPTSWYWDFGDGTTSTAQNPVHTYANSGYYTVSLTATNDFGSTTQTSNSYIYVYPPPVASFTATPTSGAVPLNVQFSDTSTGNPTTWAWFFGDETYNEGWNQVSTNNPIWTPRYNQSSVVMPDGSIVLMGGYDGSPEDDVWLSPDDGVTWMEMNTNAGWPARYGQSSVVMPDGSIVLMGGFDGTNYYNDVWQSWDDGTTWTEINISAGWSARYGQSCVVMPDGSIVLMGGQDSNGLDNDVWQSLDDGATWTQVNQQPYWWPYWSGRYGQSSVVMPDGSIVLMGGQDSNGPEDDVWQSTDEGVTWTEVNYGALWSGRTGQSSVVMPDGSIVLMGGQDIYDPENDVYQSPPGSDGVTWNPVNYDAISSGRYGQSSVAMPDGSIVLIGGYDWYGGLDNDVWQLWPAGSYYTPTPSHTYNSPGSYSVALEVSNSAGYNSTLIPGDITVSPSNLPVSSVTTISNTTGAIQSTVSGMSDGDILILNPGIYWENDITFSSTITIEANTTAGGNPSNTIIDGINGNSGIFVASGGASLTIDNLTLRDGYTTGSGGAIFTYGSVIITSSTIVNCTATSGGAIYASGVTDTNSTFANCSATGTASSFGGAIYANGGDVTDTNSTFANCSATGTASLFGGAIYAGGGDVTDTGSTFTGCTASSEGGAIYASGVTDTNSTFTNCSTPWDGGAIFASDTVTDTGSTFTNCSTTGNGGAICSGNTVTTTRSTFANCSADYGGAVNANSGSIQFCRLVNDTGLGTAVSAGNSVALDATDDWWGTNSPSWSSLVNGDVLHSPWLELGITSLPQTIDPTGTSTIQVNITYDSTGSNTSTSGTIPDGIPVVYGISGLSGSLLSMAGNTTTGMNSTLFTPARSGPATIDATVDDQTVSTIVNVTGGSGLPSAGFSSNVTSGPAPLAVEFNDISDVISPLMWNWSFGDGTWFNTTDITARNANYLYNNPGTYDVSLTVTNASGSNTDSRTGYISVAESSPYIDVNVNGSINNWDLVTGTNQDTGSVSVNITTNMNSWSVSAADALDGGKTSGTAGYMAEYDGSAYVPSGIVLKNPLNVNFGGGSYIALSGTDQTITSGTSPGTTSGILGISQLVEATDPALVSGHQYRIIVTLTGCSA
jgi:PKD repeat protein